MTEVGAVSIALELDRSRFNKDLRELESLKLEPLNLDIKLNASNLQRQIRDLNSVAKKRIAIELSPDVKGFERQIRNLSKSIPAIDVEVNPDIKGFQKKLKTLASEEIDCLDVCLHPDIQGFKKKLSKIYELDIDCVPIKLCPDLEGFDRKVRRGLQGKKYSTDIGLDTGGFKKNIEDAFTDALKRVEGKGIASKIGGIFTAPLKGITGAIAPIFLGLGASIGLPLGQQIGTGLRNGLQTKFGSVIGSFELVGDAAGRVIGGGIESGFSKGLDAAKNNADQIVKVLEEKLGKKRLLKLFGANYSREIPKAIRDIAPGKAISEALGERDVLIESRRERGENNARRVGRIKKASAQLEVEQQVAGTTLQGLKQNAAAIDKQNAAFLEEYNRASGTLTESEHQRFQSIAKNLDARRSALEKQVSIIQSKSQQAAVGLSTLGTSKVKPQNANLPALYTNVVNQVASISGIKIPENLIPSLRISEKLRPGAFGEYDHRLNQINVSKKAYESLESGKVDLETIDTLVHELRHALQFGFGKIDVPGTGATGVELLSANSDQKKKLGRQIEQSVEVQPPDKQAIARRIETDAYVFASRNAKAIAQNIQQSGAIKSFESAFGLGGAKADLQLKRAQLEQLKKIQQINALASTYGVDLQADISASNASISASELKLEPLLEKARNLEVLPAEEIVALQKEIQLELQSALIEVARQSELVKSALIQKKQQLNPAQNPSGSQKRSQAAALQSLDGTSRRVSQRSEVTAASLCPSVTSGRDSAAKKQLLRAVLSRATPTEAVVAATPPELKSDARANQKPSTIDPSLESRINQLTKPQLNSVAKQLGITYSGKKAAALRAEVLASDRSKLESALPAVFQEVSSSIKAEADELSNLTLEALKARAKEVQTVIKQGLSEATQSSGTNKSSILQELLQGIEDERQLIKETLTRELDKDVRNTLKAQLAALGKPSRRALTEYRAVVGGPAPTNRNNNRAKPPSVDNLAQRSGNSFDALPSVEDVNDQLNVAKSQVLGSGGFDIRVLASAQKRAFGSLTNSVETLERMVRNYNRPIPSTLSKVKTHLKRLEASLQNVSALSNQDLDPKALHDLAILSEKETSDIVAFLKEIQETRHTVLEQIKALEKDRAAIPKNGATQTPDGAQGVEVPVSVPPHGRQSAGNERDTMAANASGNQRPQATPAVPSGAPLSRLPVPEGIVTERQLLRAASNERQRASKRPPIQSVKGKQPLPSDNKDQPITLTQKPNPQPTPGNPKSLAELASGRKLKRKKTSGSSNEIKELEATLKSVDDALNSIDKEVKDSLKSQSAQAAADVKNLRGLNAKINRQLARQSKKVDAALKSFEEQTVNEVAEIELGGARRLKRQRVKLENRLQRRYGLEASEGATVVDAPTPSFNPDDEVKSIIGAAKGVFKRINTTRFNAAKKQVMVLSRQAEALLIDIDSQVTIGKTAEAEAKVLQRAIVANEKKIEKILGAIKKANSGKSPKLNPEELQKLSGEFDSLSRVIDADKQALAVAKNRAAKGQELAPIAKDIRSSIGGASTTKNIQELQGFNSKLRETFEILGQEPPQNLFSSVGDFIAGIDGSLTSVVGKIGNFVKGFLAFQGFLLIQNAVKQLAVNSFNAFVEVDKLRTALSFASGGAVAGARNLEFVRKTVDDLKIPLLAAEQGFTKLQAAVRNSPVERATRNIFTGVAQASTVLSLSAEQTGGIYTSLSQSASKGRVQTEEILQLAESGGLSGAFAIAARSMNVTEAAFTKMLETGQVLSQDFLPRFGKQLQSEFGDAALSAAGNAASAVYGLQNSFLEFQRSIGTSIGPATVAGLNTLSSILKSVSSVMGELIAATAALSIALLIKLGSALKQTIANLILTRATGATLSGAFSDAAKFINNSATVKIAVGVFAIFEAVKLLYDTVNTELVKSFDNAARAAERAAKASLEALNPPKKDDRDKDKDNLPDINFVDTLTKGYARSDLMTKIAANAYLAGAPGIGELINRGAGFVKTGKFDYYSYAELQRDNLISNVGDLNFGNERLIFNATNQLQRLKTAGGSGGIDAQIKQAESDRRILQGNIERSFTRKGLLVPPEYNKQVEDLTKKIEQLNDQKNNLAQPVTLDLQRINNAIASTLTKIKELEDPKVIAALGGEEEAQRQKIALETTLKGLRQFKFNADGALASLKIDPVLAFTEAIRKLNIELGNNQEASQKAFLQSKARIALDAVAGFNSKVDSSDSSSLENAQAERDKAASDLTSFEKDYEGKRAATAAPEFAQTLTRFGLTNQSTAADIQGVIDRPETEDPDKKILEQVKAAKEAEVKVLEASSQAAEASLKLKQQQQQKLLNAIQRYADEALAISKRTENEEIALVRQGQIDRTTSEEEATVEVAQIQYSGLERQKGIVDDQLDLLRHYYQQGSISAEQFSQKERELLNQQSSLKLQLIEQEKVAREAAYKAALDLAEQANSRVSAAIAVNQTERNTAAKQLQLSLMREVGDQRLNELQISGVNIETEQITAEERIKLIKVELEQVKVAEQAKMLSTKEANAKRLQLNQQLAEQNDKLADSEIAKEKNLRDIAIQGIEAQRQALKNKSDLAISLLEQEKGIQDLLNKSLERTKQLEESRYNLSKAISDAAIASDSIKLDGANKALELSRKLKDQNLDVGVEAAIRNALTSSGFGTTELEILRRRQAIENEIAARKLAALKVEQQYQRRSLQLDLQKQRIAQETASFEAEVAQLKSQQAVIDATAALGKARQSEDKLAIEAAEVGLSIAERQLDLSNKQLDNARASLEIQSEISQNALAAQAITHQSALDSANAGETQRRQSQPIERAEVTAGNGNKSTNQADTTGDTKPGGGELPADTQSKKQKFPSLFEQSKGRVFAPDTFVRNYLPPDQSGSRGLDRSTSTEAFLARSLQIDPSESAESYQIRRLGLDPKESAESYQIRRLGIDPRKTALAPLNPSPTEAALTNATKPVDTSTSQTSGFSQFVDGLKEANKGIEQRLDQLIQGMATSAASPRNLYVSSPTPVSDAAQIYSDLARGMTTAAGLG